MGKEALIVIDLQNDFCPGGALAVAEGDTILPHVNKLIARSSHVILTQDWHPQGHKSFASAHAGFHPYQQITMPYGLQTLWPDHCVAGTKGADFHEQLETQSARLILRKGTNPDIDSYSAFLLILCGLATDFCVAWSALDAVKLGFAACIILEASQAIDLNGSFEAALLNLQKQGVELLLRS